MEAHDDDYCVTIEDVASTTIRCNLCRVNMFSFEQKKNHVKSKKHREKVKKLRQGKIRKPPPISNPTVPAKPKPVERLAAKIERVEDPVVGLVYVDEFLPSSTDQLEPIYKCRICQAEGEGKVMLSHLIGHNHRRNFFFAETGKLYSEAECARMADFYCEKDTTFRVKTHVGDDTYPWPQGSRPSTTGQSDASQNTGEKHIGSRLKTNESNDTNPRPGKTRPFTTEQGDTSKKANKKKFGLKTNGRGSSKPRPRNKRPSTTGKGDAPRKARSWNSYLANKHYVDKGPDGPAGNR